jgi:hypothetical protein
MQVFPPSPDRDAIPHNSSSLVTGGHPPLFLGEAKNL